MTDFADCLSHYWIEPQEQFLICPTERAVAQAQSLGYPTNQIFRTSGLVIHPRFYEPITVDRRVERQHLGLDPDLPTGLIMFGGYGSNRMIEIAECLEQSALKIQLIFICGYNQELATALHNIKTRFPIAVKTFTDQVPYYMYLSDFFVGKPGSASMSEALAMGLPVITERNAATLIQERYNTEWLVSQQVGLLVKHFRQIDQPIAKLIQPENLADYRSRVKALNNQAVFEVAEILQKILETPKLDDRSAPSSILPVGSVSHQGTSINGGDWRSCQPQL